MAGKLVRDELEKAVIGAMDHASKNVAQWGVDDCYMWSISPLREALGYDAGKKFRGRYSDSEGALDLAGKLGLGFVLRATAKEFGWSRIDPSEAQTGDIGLAIITGEVTTVLCRAPGWFLARNEHGYSAFRSDAVRIAWSVVSHDQSFAD